MSELRDAAETLFGALDALHLAYAVGGSFASSMHGIARATQNLDLIVDLPLARVADLYRAVCKDFYVDEEAMRDAIRRGMSFNLIHLESGFKFDLFVASRHPLGHDQLAHCKSMSTSILGGDPLEAAEDIVLAKLLWDRQGGGVSERQWNDIVNLATVQRNRLGQDYLTAQAARLGVADLLRELLLQER
jgi:hypothetical protein